MPRRGWRYCWKCSHAYPPEEFLTFRYRLPDGSFKYSVSGCCLICSRADGQVTRQRKLTGESVKFPYYEWAKLLRKLGYKCPRCGARGVLAIDHVIPVSAGGRLVLENIQPLCASCNSRKGGVRRPRQRGLDTNGDTCSTP